jgi:hypothetical protein
MFPNEDIADMLSLTPINLLSDLDTVHKLMADIDADDSDETIKGSKNHI